MLPHIKYLTKSDCVIKKINKNQAGRKIKKKRKENYFFLLRQNLFFVITFAIVNIQLNFFCFYVVLDESIKN